MILSWPGNDGDIGIMVTENEMIEMLRKGEVTFPPLLLRLAKIQPRNKSFSGSDALIEVTWENKKALFSVEIKAEYYPKAFNDALRQIQFYSQRVSKPSGQNLFLLISPYLDKGKLEELEKLGISGIDLCGNGLIIIPGELFILRSGSENRYPIISSIKKIYQKNSSMIGRAFLARPKYKAVGELLSEINKRNLLVDLGIKQPMSFSTISKVLKSLVDDLIVERNDYINLLQPDKLLEKLSDDYIKPNIKEAIRIKVPGTIESILNSIMKLAKLRNEISVITGLSSVKKYAVMQREELVSIYTTNFAQLINNLPGIKNDRFPNLEVLETDDERVYFDYQRDKGIFWASPVQVYLELMQGDKRDKETAKQVEAYILDNLKDFCNDYNS